MEDRNPKTSNKAIRVLLFAKYPMVLDCLSLLLEKSKGISVTGACSLTEDLKKTAQIASADVAVIYFVYGDQVELISVLLVKNPRLRIIMLIAGADLNSQAKALELGAVGIVQKDQNPSILIEAIRQTHEGKTWLNQVLLNKILNGDKSNGKKSTKLSFHLGVESLTAREIEVVRMIGEGLKNKIIAERLFISEATVRHHLSTIYGKTGVEDRLNLVIFAHQNGLIDLAEVPEYSA
jgi:DNA-binding NarL/FixJ family response regulator